MQEACHEPHFLERDFWTEERLHSQISELPDFGTESIKPQCHYRIHSRRTPCWYVAGERRHDQ
jgi:hypothetical protein